MVKHKNRGKQVVWQDIVPVQRPQKPVAKNTKTLKKIKEKIASLSSPKLPIFKKVRIRFPKIPRKTLSIGAVICMMAIISLGIYYSSITRTTKVIPKSDGRTVSNKPVLEHGTPKYSTILPADKNIKDLGGWTRVSPSDSDPVFAYADKIGDISIIVSQQPLPDNFKTDTAQAVEGLAQDFKATEKITVGDITVHIGSSQDGPQSIIFSKGDLLILIKSSSKITNDQLIKYISSLK